MLGPGRVFRLHDLAYFFDPRDADLVVEAWLAGAADRPEIGWTRAEFETHLRTEYNTFNWLLEPMLERAGFEIRDAHHDPRRVYSAYTCVKTR